MISRSRIDNFVSQEWLDVDGRWAMPKGRRRSIRSKGNRAQLANFPEEVSLGLFFGKLRLEKKRVFFSGNQATFPFLEFLFFSLLLTYRFF